MLVLVALAATIVGGIYAWWSRPQPEPLAPPPPISGPSPAGAADTARPRPSPGSEVTVHVTGKVREPGVVSLPQGSRVTDAVRAAGGVRKGAALGPLNLARRLIDGEQIVVGSPAHAAPAVPSATGPSAVDPAAVLDLNAATPEQLEQLPGVGEVLARRIAEYRDSHGGFQRVEQLRDVSGIGDRKYADIKDKVRV
ncbi:ComEA family DNA-binding protein [Planobispora takensis]|uniref:ComEA family DNA-binding protein n=1 Tax=Planobispora takensis TaxID=1367882 RepID=UPI0019452907|nr:ComEA family DNA-binding protein [Planobispora takensis]